MRLLSTQRALALFLGATAGLQPPTDEPVRLEVLADPAVALVGRPVAVRLRVSIDEPFLRDHLLQLFRRELDVPVQVETGWGALPEVDLRARPAAGTTLVLDGEVVDADHERTRSVDGRLVREWELELELVPRTAGEHELPGPTLRYAWTPSRETDLFGSDRSAERRDVTTGALPLRLRAEPPPRDGRPDDWIDAVGDLRLEAVVAERRVRVGETLRLELQVTGAGNLAALTLPRIDLGPDVHVLGTTERASTERRVLVLDLVPRAPGRATLPAVELPYFDPVRGAYRTARSRPVPIEVLPAEADARAEPAGEPPAPGGPRPAVWLPLGALAVVVAVLVARRVRRA